MNFKQMIDGLFEVTHSGICRVVYDKVYKKPVKPKLL